MSKSSSVMPNLQTSSSSPPSEIQVSGGEGDCWWINDTWTLSETINECPTWRRRGNPVDMIKYNGSQWTINGTPGYHDKAYWNESGKLNKLLPPKTGWQSSRAGRGTPTLRYAGGEDENGPVAVARVVTSSTSGIAIAKAVPLAEMKLDFSGNADNFEGGALFTIGTSFGAKSYRNPWNSKAVDAAFSADAANYYSSSTGHRQGDKQSAAEVICSLVHPGVNATMWSRGAPGAWFSIDLKSAELSPTHYCYRGDAGGGENHPRSWELQGSRDGHTWETLKQHVNDKSVQRHRTGSFPVKTDGAYYRFFRVVNCGKPNHLCCSGIEFFGTLRTFELGPDAHVKGSAVVVEVHASSNANLGDLTVIEARYGWAGDIWAPSTCGHAQGCKDVTKIVRGDISGNELHINRDCRPQYMNQHFWPETAHGPPIPRKLAVRYRYGNGPVLTKETPAVPHETVCLDITPSSVPTNSEIKSNNSSKGTGKWTQHENIDMCFQGDAEIIHNWRSTHSIEDLKKIVETKGYSAVCVGSFGHAALKNFDYQLTPQHCKPSQGYTNSLYIYNRSGLPNTVSGSEKNPYSSWSKNKLNDELNSTARNTNDIDKIRQLVAAGADLSSTNGGHWRHTALHQACYHGRLENARLLIQLGSRLDLPSNPCGRGGQGLPIDLARGGGHHSIVALLQQGAGNTKLDNSNGTGKWTQHENIDMCGQGDVEVIHNWRSKHSIEDLKKIVEKKGYSAISVGSFGHAALKKFNYQLTPQRYKTSQGYTNTIWIYNPSGSSGGGSLSKQRHGSIGPAPSIRDVLFGIGHTHLKAIIFPFATMIMAIVALATADPDGMKCTTDNDCDFPRYCGVKSVVDEEGLCTPKIGFYGVVFLPAIAMFVYIFVAIIQNAHNRKGMISSFGFSLWLHWGFPYYVFIVLMFNGYYGHEVGLGALVMCWSLFCSLSGVYFSSPDPNMSGFQLTYWNDPNRRRPHDWINAEGVVCLQGKPEGCSCLPGRCGGFSRDLNAQHWFHNMPPELIQFDISNSQWKTWMDQLNAAQNKHSICDGIRCLNCLSCYPWCPFPNPAWFICMWFMPVSAVDPFQSAMKRWLEDVNKTLRPRGGLCKVLTFAETTTGGGYWKDGSLSIIVFAHSEEEVKRLEREPCTSTRKLRRS